MTLDSQIAELVSRLFWRHQAIQINNREYFRLASGGFAPIYINCRCLISYPGSREIIISCAQYLFYERRLRADGVAGGETAGIPFGAWLAKSLAKPFVYVRKQKKGHGIGSLVEGAPEGTILLFEDLITDGRSKIAFVNGIRDTGCEIADCMVVVDREQGGGVVLGDHGVALHSLVRLSTILEVGLQTGHVTEESLKETRQYLEDPSGWNLSKGFRDSSD